MKPYNETAVFEFGNNSEAFYASGSSISIGEAGSFSRPLRNKDQIRLSFSVKNSVTMLTNSSSIYYFSPVDGQWQIPSRARGDLTGPFGNFTFPTKWGTGSGSVAPFGTYGSFFTEDAKGFTPYGRCVASGSADPASLVPDPVSYAGVHINSLLNSSSINAFDAEHLSNNYVKLLTADYPKSVQRSNVYSPVKNEVFQSPNAYPFLVEKVVVEIPLSMGESWFRDRTTTTIGWFRDSRYNDIQIDRGENPVSASYFYDRGGPALTVSLFSKKNYGTGSILDLIASGSITHEEDIRDINIRDVPQDCVPYMNYYPGSIFGSLTEPGLLVATSLGIDDRVTRVAKKNLNRFTGSVAVKMTAGISNGIEMIANEVIPFGDLSVPPSIVKNYFANLIGNETYELSNGSSFGLLTEFRFTDVDPFGRGMTGFSQSGGSIFGYEYNTSNALRPITKVKNPFYISSVTRRGELTASFNDYVDYYDTVNGQTPTLCSVANISFSSNKPSPYLMNPGETLVLAISKTRPALTGVSYNINGTTNALTGLGTVRSIHALTGTSPSAEIGHDVQLSTGSINITLYGSYVRNNAEYVP